MPPRSFPTEALRREPNRRQHISRRVSISQRWHFECRRAHARDGTRRHHGSVGVTSGRDLPSGHRRWQRCPVRRSGTRCSLARGTHDRSVTTGLDRRAGRGGSDAASRRFVATLRWMGFRRWMTACASCSRRVPRASCPLMMAVRLEDLRQRQPTDIATDLPPWAVRQLIRSHPAARLIITHADRDFIEQVHFGSTPQEASRILWDISWIWGPPEDHLELLLDHGGNRAFHIRHRHAAALAGDVARQARSPEPERGIAAANCRREPGQVLRGLSGGCAVPRHFIQRSRRFLHKIVVGQARIGFGRPDRSPRPGLPRDPHRDPGTNGQPANPAGEGFRESPVCSRGNRWPRRRSPRWHRSPPRRA